MLVLPLPLLTFLLATLACAMVWRIDPGTALARRFFTAVFALIALVTLLIGLRFGYGMERLVAVQRIVPLFIGPTIWLGFVSLTRPPVRVRPLAWLHFGIAAAVALLPQILPLLRTAFDLAIAASYLLYGTALLRLWRKGPDALPFARLGMTEGLRRWMLVAAAMLAIMLVFDLAIAASFALERREEAVRLIALGSGLSLLALLAAIMMFPRNDAPVPVSKAAQKRDDGDDERLEAAARTLLTVESLYLDTDLTLDRLAKRLHVPSRTLSAAINRTQGVNVSQYVNGFRLDHAVRLLHGSNLSVREIAERSGFLTRSNFYRAFNRAYGCTPAQFRAGPQ